MKKSIFTSVFTKLQSKLQAKASTILGSSEDVDDALQDAFCRLWAMDRDPENIDHAVGLSMVTVGNISIDMVRRRASQRTDAMDEIETLHRSTEGDDDTRELYDEVTYIIDNSLSPRDREIFRKREIDDMDYAEIAAQYDMSEANVRMIISRARRTIRDIYFKRNSHGR